MTTTDFPFATRANFEESNLMKLRSAKRVEVERVGSLYIFGVHIEPHREHISRWAVEHQEENSVSDEVIASLDTASIPVPNNWWFAKNDVVVASRRDLAFELLKDVLDPYGKNGRLYKKTVRAAEKAW
jgi:hypothetical protein